MALNYILTGMSIAIFIIYLIMLFLLIEIKRKVDKDSGRAFIYLIITVLFLIIRRLQGLFVNSGILNPITYSEEIITVFFVIFFFLSVISLYRTISGLERGSSKRGIFGRYKD